MRISDADPEMLRFLGKRGIVPGTKLELVDRQPFDGPLFVRVGKQGPRPREPCSRGPCAWRLRDPRRDRRCRGTRTGDHTARGAAPPRSVARDADDARPGVRRLDRLRRSGQLRHQHRGRRPLRLPPALGRARGELDGHADPVPVGQARDRHRQQPSRELPGALPALDVLGNVGAGRDHLDVHRHRRVPRRGARAQPALPRPALHRRRDDRLHRLRPPRAAPPRIPPVRARDHGAARDHLPRLPLREPQDRPLRPRQHPELPAASARLDRGPVPRGRDHRRDGHAACHLSPLRAHQGPHARPQRRRALPRASVRAHRRDHRPRPRRADQPDHARRRRQALPRRRSHRCRHDPGRAHRARQPRRRRRCPRVRHRPVRVRRLLVERRHLRRAGGHGRLRQRQHLPLRPADRDDGPGPRSPRRRSQPDERAGPQPGGAVVRDSVRAHPARAAHEPSRRDGRPRQQAGSRRGPRGRSPR